ncbi:hypothetical protein BX616_005500, partial [Lobosporangium transversale]
AREKFGNQKAISSDQYFGRNNYDAEAQAEATSRLQAFSGATSISSNQYFGRQDEPPSLGSDVSLASLGNLSGSDLAKKLGQADLATLKNAVQAGAGKLADMVQDIQSRGPQYNRLYQRLALFEKETGNKVEIVFRGSHPELNDFLASTFNSTISPSEISKVQLDLISTHIKYAPSQVHFLQELGLDLVSDQQRSEFLDSALEASKVQNRLVQLPRMVDSRVLFYRADVFEKLGLTPPKTWQDLLMAASAIRRAELPVANSPNVSASDRGTGEASSQNEMMEGYIFPGKLSGLFGTFYELAMMEMQGSEALFDRQGRPIFEENVVINVLRFLRELVVSNAVPKDIERYYFDEVSALFAEGKVAMVADWPSFYGEMKRTLKEKQPEAKIKVMRYPVGANGKRVAYSGMHSFAIPTSCRHGPQATKLLHFLVRDDQQWIEASESGSFPTKRAVLQRLVEKTEEKRRLEGSEAELDSERLECLKMTVEKDMAMFPHLKTYPELEEALYPVIQGAMMGRVTCQEAAQQMKAIAIALGSVYEQCA